MAKRKKAGPKAGVQCLACGVSLTDEQLPIHDAMPEHQAAARAFVGNRNIDAACAKVVPGYTPSCPGFQVIGRPFLSW